jgi:pantoate--beta-alanine ligase
MQQVVHDPDRMRALVNEARAAGQRVGFVPTMGALHAGHTSLVAQAARECDRVAVSIFVNPTQFGPQEDFSRYPRTLAADTALLAAYGVDWIYAPEVSDVYPPGDATRIVVGGPAVLFEGERRPGHFDGVSTVVCKLVLAVPADTAYFGAKDWQQTLVVKRLVRDLGLPIRIIVCPTMREPDGLAMSSRNAYLSTEERAQATVLRRALDAVKRAVAKNPVPAVEMTQAVARLIATRPAARLDYVAFFDAKTLEPVATVTRGTRMALAVRLGKTRLIDNDRL